MNHRFNERNPSIAEQNGEQRGTLVRGVGILDILKEHGASTLKEISERAGIHKSTVLRLLATLERLGLVEHNRESRKYRLDVRLIEYARRVSWDHEFLRVARPSLERLRDATGERTNLAVLDRDSVIWIESLEGRNPLAFNFVGKARPHTTAAGRAMLAYMSDEEVERIYDLSRMLAQADDAIPSLEALREELLRTKNRGYSLNEDSEGDQGLRRIGSPIFGPAGRVKGAISISAPAYRFQKDVYLPLIPALQSATFDISRAIGADDSVLVPLTRLRTLQPSR